MCISWDNEKEKKPGMTAGIVLGVRRERVQVGARHAVPI